MQAQVRASLVLALVIAVFFTSGVQLLEGPDDLRLGDRSKFTISRLFDFVSYKKLFNKSYSSVAEELMRQKIFWPRAFRAVISAAKYKAGQATYYLALNQMSDMTPEELQKMINDANENYRPTFQFKRKDSSELSEVEPELEDLPNGHTGDFERDLIDYVRSRPNDPVAEELKNQIITDELADLPIEDLIDHDDKVKLDKETELKIADEVPSESLATHLSPVSRFERVEFETIKSDRLTDAPKLKRHMNFRKRLTRLGKAIWDASLGGATREPDEVFLDLRDTKCFDLPRVQGTCGACWAFVMTSILEWLHCMKTGRLVKFSEQYMVDCGYDNVATLDGCNGGNPMAAANFVRNFGIELRTRWPYRMREHQCPYREDTPLESTGYFRFPLSKGLSVHLDKVPEQLKSGPLYVSIMVTRDFAEFGGGVHGFSCSSATGRHAMALIGHGRENGQEYWLLRNTYGPGWGEDGYYKLAKDARCIMPPQAYVYGSAQQLNETNYFEVNKFRNETLVRRHFDLITAQD